MPYRSASMMLGIGVFIRAVDIAVVIATGLPSGASIRGLLAFAIGASAFGVKHNGTSFYNVAIMFSTSLILLRARSSRSGLNWLACPSFDRTPLQIQKHYLKIKSACQDGSIFGILLA